MVVLAVILVKVLFFIAVCGFVLVGHRIAFMRGAPFLSVKRCIR